MKKRFLNELKRHLGPLEENERQAILDFYEERFEVGTKYEGKSESEVIDELEPPSQIASNVLRSYGYSTADESAAPRGGIGSAVGVLLFDVFVAWWLVMVLLTVAFAFSSGLLSVVTGLFGGSTLVTQILSTLAVISAFALWVFFVLWVYDRLITFFIWLIRWHVQAFSLPGMNAVRSLRKLKAEYWLRRNSTALKVKSRVKGIGTLVLLLSLIGFVAVEGTFTLRAGRAQLSEYEETFAVPEDGSLDVYTDMDIGSLLIRHYDGEEILVEKAVNEDADVDIALTDNTLQVENDLIGGFLSFNWVFTVFPTHEETTTIFIPESVSLESIDANTKNGSIDIEDLEAASIRAESSNGAIRLNGLEADSIEGRSSNGRIDFDALVAGTLDARTSNGRITVRDSQADTLEGTTSNGNVTYERINAPDAPGEWVEATSSNGSISLSDVYAAKAELKTSNGDIDFYNADRSHAFERVDYHTQNGRSDVDVPRQ